MPLPALRMLDAHPIEHEGEQYICLNDPSGIVEEQLLLSPMAFFIAAQLTGLNELEDVQRAFRERFGGMDMPSDRIVEVVDHLDERGFLNSPRFAELENGVLTEFRESSVRKAHLAGKSYPEDPEELREFLDSQFDREGAPGELPGEAPGKGKPLPGLVVPHIDLQRGGHSYAHGYLHLFRHGRPDTVFIFGVAHMAEPVPFILTRKDFETPFGVVETDREFVAHLEAACEWDPYEYEIVHRTEHSIEFQAVMLAYLYGPTVRIVPILCSMFSADLNVADPSTVPELKPFLDACRACVQSGEKQVSVIAAVDLAHVGKRFGDGFDIDDKIIEGVAARDEEDLAFVQSMDADRFYSSVMKDANERRVCGLNCLYAFLKTLEGVAGRGNQLHYGYAHDPAGGIVSFASMSLT